MVGSRAAGGELGVTAEQAPGGVGGMASAGDEEPAGGAVSAAGWSGAGGDSAEGLHKKREPQPIPSGPPRCSVDQIGAFCGEHLRPEGEQNTRYFCEVTGLVASSACPGSCDPQQNICVSAAGTGSGQGDNKRPVAKCVMCYATICQAEYLACDSDDLCDAHRDCITGCDPGQACEDNCAAAFPDEPLWGELVQCANEGGCAEACAEVF